VNSRDVIGGASRAKLYGGDAQDHNRDLVHGLLKGKSVQETFSDISRDTTLSHAYLDKLKSIYTSPAYQDSIESHPLREKKLKKEIIDAWVEEWRRNQSKCLADGEVEARWRRDDNGIDPVRALRFLFEHLSPVRVYAVSRQQLLTS
jgi:hypothetical protein